MTTQPIVTDQQMYSCGSVTQNEEGRMYGLTLSQARRAVGGRRVRVCDIKVLMLCRLGVLIMYNNVWGTFVARCTWYKCGGH